MRSAGNSDVFQSRLQVLPIHVLYIAPLGTRYMAQPCADQHQGRIPIGECPYHAGPTADLTVQPLDHIIGADARPVLGSKNKYKLNKQTGRIQLDRVLYAAMIYPAEYGIVENTLAPDGDPLDILVICSDPTFPGCIVPARMLDYLSMVDNGRLDYKLISVVDCDQRYADVQELSDLSPFVLKEISNFFANYKVLQNVTVEVGEYHSKQEAVDIIARCRKAYMP